MAAIALVSLFPLLLVISVLIVMDSPGPVFYRAERVGFGRRPLRMLKFRKMHEGARGVALTVADDDRLTRLGKWLVRTKLDELPQLWHVLRGEMSLVGPRPESPGFVARFPADYDVILQVRPGLTGYTQLAFARELSILDPRDPLSHYIDALLPQKVVLDRIYASRMSNRRDLRILLATLASLFLRQPVAVHRTTAALTLRRRAPRSTAAVAVADAVRPAMPRRPGAAGQIRARGEDALQPPALSEIAPTADPPLTSAPTGGGPAP